MAAQTFAELFAGMPSSNETCVLRHSDTGRVAEVQVRGHIVRVGGDARNRILTAGRTCRLASGLQAASFYQELVARLILDGYEYESGGSLALRAVSYLPHARRLVAIERRKQQAEQAERSAATDTRLASLPPNYNGPFSQAMRQAVQAGILPAAPEVTGPSPEKPAEETRPAPGGDLFSRIGGKRKLLRDDLETR